MKTLITFLLLLVPVSALSQNFQGMSEADMQNMMQQMGQMQTCMDKIDQEDMDALQQRSQQMDAEIKSLCAQGKRDEAQAKAMAYGREMASDPTVRQLQECGDMMQGVLPDMQYMREEEYADRHVCDN